jgi:hypothetical protein
LSHRDFGIRGIIGREFHTSQNPESRFTDSIGAIDWRRDTWREIPEDRDSAFGVSRGKSHILFEVATSDFPSQREPSIIGGIGGTNPERSGFRRSGNGEVRVLCPVKSRVAISRINGSHRSSEGQVASDPGYRSSAFRGFRHQKKLVPWIRDPRNPEEDVARWDPKTEWGDRCHRRLTHRDIGDRGARVSCIAESRNAISR